MTDKSAAAIREFAEKQFPLSKELKKEVLYNQIQQAKQNECLSDLTALISEGYVSKEEHAKVLQQRDELREVLKRFTECMRRYWADTYQEEAPDLSLVIEAEAAIKNTEG